MSDLRPTGIPIVVDGVERHLLFTLNAIDEIQEHFNMELGAVIDGLTDKKLSSATLRFVLLTLLNDEAEQAISKGKESKVYTPKDIGWIITLDNQIEYALAILKAYGISLPEAEGDIPNQLSGQTKK